MKPLVVPYSLYAEHTQTSSPLLYVYVIKAGESASTIAYGGASIPRLCWPRSFAGTSVRGAVWVYASQSRLPPFISRSKMLSAATKTLNTPANSISAPGIGLSASGERKIALVE